MRETEVLADTPAQQERLAREEQKEIRAMPALRVYKAEKDPKGIPVWL